VHVDDTRVLLICKSRLTRLKLIEGLKTKNFLFFEADGVKEALSMNTKFHPNLLFCELEVSLEHPELISDLKKTSPKLKVTLVGNRNQIAEHFSKLGPDDYLQKPFTPDLVALKVLSILFPDESQKLDARSIFKVRKYQRIPVTGVTLRIYVPFYEKTDVLEISNSGLRIHTENLAEVDRGHVIKMEIISRVGNMSLSGKLLWYKDGDAGIAFARPKPKGFRSLLDGLCGIPTLPS